MKKRVLIPTNDPGYIEDLVKSYCRLGYEPIAGSLNFHLYAGSYDIIHILWPEFLCESRPPSDKEIDDIGKKLEWWNQRSRLIISVQNFYPHAYEYDPSYKKLYNVFYSACSGITHFSRTSVEWVCKEFPAAATKKNIITTPINYNRLVQSKFDRGTLRRNFGFSENDFVILVFGAIRKWEEAQLIRRAYAKAKIPRKRLLLGCRFSPRRGSRFSRLCCSALWKSWIRTHRFPHCDGFIPDEDIYRYVEASDLVIIPRINDLNSGILYLGMTFGKMLIAPNHGSYPDNLEGTENLLYKSGDPKALAAAMEKAFVSDRELIGSNNREIAQTWGTDNLAEECIKLAEMA